MLFPGKQTLNGANPQSTQKSIKTPPRSSSNNREETWISKNNRNDQEDGERSVIRKNAGAETWISKDDCNNQEDLKRSVIRKNAGGETEIYRTNLKKSGEKEKRSPMESPEILEIKEKENQEERKKITWKDQNQENKTIEKKGNKKGNGSSIVESATETMLEKN